MVFSAKNAVLKLDGAKMDYIRFGTGPRNLVILPGLGDGLRTVNGTAVPMAWMYRSFAREFTVYAFSRREPLPAGFTTCDMAADLVRAMELLGLEQADLLGVSMGGMIAQQLAAHWPGKVSRLVLAVTAPGPGPIMQRSLDEWVELAGRSDHRGLMDSNVRRIYSREYYRRNKWLIPVMGVVTKPASYERFLIQARACSSHDARGILGRIQAPTLVIGAEQDLVLGGDASRELAEAIPGAQLKMYPQWGHGVYEEAEDFNPTVLRFLTGGSV